MHTDNFILRPIVVGNNVVERVNNYKLLGVQLSEDLKWNKHVEYIYKKACKKLYSLRVLRRAGVEQKNILKVYFIFFILKKYDTFSHKNELQCADKYKSN